jgi:hypothetical protein
MVPANSPFPCHWWGTSLETVGLGELRPDVGTYGRYSFERLPPLPFPLSGDFAWLAAAPAQRHNIRTKYGAEIAGALQFLRESAESVGVPLPEAFTKFMGAPSLQERIRSTTDCYLDLCPELIRSPLGGGWLVHFLADSQGCLFWYLYLTADGSDHAIVSSPDFYSTALEQLDEEESDSDDDAWEEQEPDPRAISFCAGSFEEFLGRFWLENEIRLTHWRKTPMPEAGHQYIEQYRSLR